ncbi:MAG: hypothetical protein WKF41_00820 [Gaiellaceae bacterium]
MRIERGRTDNEHVVALTDGRFDEGNQRAEMAGAPWVEAKRTRISADHNASKRRIGLQVRAELGWGGQADAHPTRMSPDY